MNTVKQSADGKPTVIDRLKAITVGEICAVVIPLGAVIGGIWWLFEPAVAGQIERVIKKYGVDKDSFQRVQGEIEDIKTKQRRVLDQNATIIFQLQQLRDELKKKPAAGADNGQ